MMKFKNQLTINKETDIPMLLLSTNLTLKSKRHMYYFPMDFVKLSLDGLIDTGALTSAISEQDLNKIKLLAPEAITDTGPAPNSNNGSKRTIGNANRNSLLNI